MDIQCFSSFPGERSPGISLYYTHIGGLLSLPGLCLLTPERRERLFRYRRPRDRARCLAAGLLMRRMHEGEPEKGRYGKPYFPDGPAFSLSHAGDYVILACSSRDVGTDIEPHRPYDPRVARRCFTEAERRWMERQEDDTGAFYALWTAKECIMKAAGAGFHMPPETFEVDMEHARSRDADGRIWYLAWRRLPGHTVCTACDVQSGVLMTQCSSRDLLRT